MTVEAQWVFIALQAATAAYCLWHAAMVVLGIVQAQGNSAASLQTQNHALLGLLGFAAIGGAAITEGLLSIAGVETVPLDRRNLGVAAGAIALASLALRKGHWHPALWTASAAAMNAAIQAGPGPWNAIPLALAALAGAHASLALMALGGGDGPLRMQGRKTLAGLTGIDVAAL